MNKSIFYIGVYFFIICFSFFFYAPSNSANYYSDTAVHVLMAKSFQLPRDFYYWGQDRLGSLLPMVAFFFGKIIPIHYLYICSLVQYLFLFTGFLFLSSQIKSNALKIALCAIIFLPPNEYHALIYIGHPYSSQLISACLFLFFLFALKKYLSENESFAVKQFFILLFLSLASTFFYAIGVWASEFNAILILIPIIFIFFDKKLQTILIMHSRKFWFILFEVLSFTFLVVVCFFYKQIKMSAFADVVYNKTFLDSGQDIWKNTSFFLDKLSTSLFFKDPHPFENFFNWFVIVLTATIIIVQKNKQEIKKIIFINSLLVVCVVSSVVLFLSRWNLRAEFCPRYFTPVYIIYCFTILLFLDNEYYRNWSKILISLLFLFFGVSYCYTEEISKKSPGPFALYGDYRKLPKGTLIGDYWDAYQINSIAIDSLQSLPFDYQTVRNWDWRDIPLSETNFYFLNDNEHTILGGLKDTIVQFGILFKYSGVKYTCNQTEVWLYHKLYPKLLSKFIIKASNGKYVTINPKNSILIANQPDPTKAEVFELVILRNGSALKTSSGKFVSANFSNDIPLVANSNKPWDWERFQILFNRGNIFNFLSVSGKFVSADRGIGNILFANRDKALDWEAFELQPQ